MTSRALSRRSIIAAAGAAAVALLTAIPSAHAGAAPPKAVTIELIVILASQTDGGSDDARIAKLPDLNQGQLKLFNTRRLVEKPQVRAEVGTDATATSKFLFTFTVEQGKPFAIKVADGPTMQLSLGDVTVPDGGGPPRYNITAELKSPGSASKITIGLSGGQRAFIGGPSYGAGTLFFGVHAKG